MNHSKYTSGFAPTYCFTEPIQVPSLPVEKLLSARDRDIILDLRRLCKLEERYFLHLDTLSRREDTINTVTMPDLGNYFFIGFDKNENIN